MQIQVSTDHNIDGNEKFMRHVEAALRTALSGFNGHITRVEVHFSDENGAEAGGVDKRCLLEVRTAHHQPVALGHTGETLERALGGAAKKGISVGSTTATASRSMAIPIWHSVMMLRPASSLMAGTCSGSATPMTLGGSRRPSRHSGGSMTFPRSSLSRAILGTTPLTSRTLAPPTARHLARRRFASPSAAMDGRKAPGSLCRRVCVSISIPASVSVVSGSRRHGQFVLRHIAQSTRLSPTRSIACRHASTRTAATSGVCRREAAKPV